MSIEMSYFKTYEFKMDEDGDYVLKRSKEEWDEFFTFNDYWEIRKTAEQIGLGDIYDKIIPYIHELPTYTDEEGKKEFENIVISPEECLRINEETGLIEKLLEADPLFSIYSKSVMNNWKKGRHVVVHYE